MFIVRDSGHYVLLILFDLSTTFDTVDRNILITWLEQSAGITGTTLDLFLSTGNEKFYVMLDENVSLSTPLACGVP